MNNKQKLKITLQNKNMLSKNCISKNCINKGNLIKQKLGS